jgi:hypothetical protein
VSFNILFFFREKTYKKKLEQVAIEKKKLNDEKNEKPIENAP